MSRPKTDPVAETFRRWLDLDTDQRQRLSDMIAGFNASCSLYDGAQAATIPTAPKPTRKRTPKPPVVVDAEVTA